MYIFAWKLKNCMNFINRPWSICNLLRTSYCGEIPIPALWEGFYLVISGPWPAIKHPPTLFILPCQWDGEEQKQEKTHGYLNKQRKPIPIDAQCLNNSTSRPVPSQCLSSSYFGKTSPITKAEFLLLSMMLHAVEYPSLWSVWVSCFLSAYLVGRMD